MTHERLSESEQKSMRHLAKAVIDQLQQGRPEDEIVRELHGEGWALEDAEQFVQKLQENKDDYSDRLAIRFPEMKPVKRQPMLGSINGVGFMLYGARDRDRESDSFVKTWCFCFVFLPVVALGSYRVIKAAEGGGWYLLGKVPLSRFAKVWNLGLMALIASSIGAAIWNAHVSSPEYIARRKFQRAEELARAGHLLQAAREYAGLAHGLSGRRLPARRKLLALAASPELGGIDPAEVTEIFQHVNWLREGAPEAVSCFQAGVVWVRKFATSEPTESAYLLRNIWAFDTSKSHNLLLELLDGPYQAVDASDVREVFTALLTVSPEPTINRQIVEGAVNWMRARQGSDPHSALRLIDVLPPDSADQVPELGALREQLLVGSVAAEPDDVELAVQLAVHYETTGKADKIKPLLMPLIERLGSTEGARLLGRILADEGQVEGAYQLLSAYLGPRLEQLHLAEQGFEQRIDQRRSEVVRHLQQGDASGFDYIAYESATDDEKRTMVLDYINRQLRGDPMIQEEQRQLIELSTVVPAALDLGVVTLRRAQAMTDPQKRQEELQRAEQTFLAIRGVAADNAMYQLRVGQVYYWLGKADEGKQEFDKLLAHSERSYDVLMAVSQVMREIGDQAAAREYLEEAYGKAESAEEKQGAAYLRSIASVATADELKWLERSNTADPQVRASLSSLYGRKAAAAGDMQGAAEHYHHAVEAYDSIPESSSMLNNSGLACLALFRVTSDEEDLNEGLSRLEKAVKLNPDSAIVLLNTSNALRQTAIQQLAAPDPELRRVASFSDFELLDFVAHNQAEQVALRKRAQANRQLQLARSYLEKATVLAPRNVIPAYQLYQMAAFLRDKKMMQAIVDQTRNRLFDEDDAITSGLKHLRFEDPPDTADRLAASVRNLRQSLEELKESPAGTATAYQTRRLNEALLTQRDISQLDFDQLVARAESAFQAAPSYGSQATVVTARLARAVAELSQVDADFARAAESARRSLGPRIVISLILQRDDALGKAARAHNDVRHVGTLMQQRVEEYDNARTPGSLAFLDGLRMKVDQVVRDACRQDPFAALERQAIGRLLGHLPAYVCDEYWVRRMSGRADADSVFDGARQRGVSVPEYFFPRS